LPFKILVCDKIADEGIKVLEGRGYKVMRAWCYPRIEFSKRIANCDALIVRSATKVEADMLVNAKKLKVIGRAGDGMDNIDIQKARSLGITVVNTPSMSSTSVAELAIGHLLSLARNLFDGTASLREGKWAKDDMTGVEIKGKTLGILGCGNIGKAVETIAMTLGMRVLAVDAVVCGRFVPLEKMLPEADFVSVHVPLTFCTRHILSEREFGMMKDGVMLIDCSRGGVVDQEALYRALLSGKVKAAALDVFEEEPPRNSKLLALRNVYATPHIGAQTYEAQLRTSTEVAKRVIEALEKSVN
jgi:D-3-phosphoglycerate dehydrogenase